MSTSKRADAKVEDDALDVDAFLNSEVSSLTRETEVRANSSPTTTQTLSYVWAQQMRRVLASFKLNPCGYSAPKHRVRIQLIRSSF